MKKRTFVTALTVMMWWLTVPHALGETLNTDSARMEVERLHRLKDSLYNKASAEAQAKYDAEFGNTRLTDENIQARRSRTMNIIAEQIETNSVNVDALASQMTLSASQFRYRLKSITGETPQGYITNIRMQKARQLLEITPPVHDFRHCPPLRLRRPRLLHARLQAVLRRHTQ